MTDEDLRLEPQEREALAAFEAARPSPGFADRVLAAAAEAAPDAAATKAAPAPEGGHRAPAPPMGRPPRPSRTRRLLGAAVLAASAAGLFVLLRPTTSTGEARPRVRQEIALGERATAVAEPGADLSWQVDRRGRAEVHQTLGDVFYRVDRSGAPFVVHTPAGEVRVLGTCFRVEVTQMDRRMVTGAAVGAAVGGLVALGTAVTVYEGRVAVDTPRGEAVATAGEVVDAAPEAPPTVRPVEPAPTTVAPPSDAEPASSAARTEPDLQDPAELARVNARLRARVAELEGILVKLQDEKAAQRKRIEEGRIVAHPSRELLLDRASRCELRMDLPDVLGPKPAPVDDATLARLGLHFDADERAAIEYAEASLWEDVRPEVRALYVEATGDTEGAAGLTAQDMGNALQTRVAPEAGKEALWRVTHALAGLASPPSANDPGSPVFRYLWLAAHLGDRFEAKLAERLGAERARELRADRYPMTTLSTMGCPVDDPP